MTCAWKDLLSILPGWLQRQIDAYAMQLQELRLRINSPPELVASTGIFWLTRCVRQEDLDFCIQTASQYSPWSAASMSRGFLTAKGGHRIGICGEAVIKNGQLAGYRTIHFLCIRIARDIPGISKMRTWTNQSVLIIGAPGWGKTTLLRDIARTLSEQTHICVIDERQELFPAGFSTGKQMDVLSGCPKVVGMEIVLRTMGPDVIAVDEITSHEDTAAVLHVANCGIQLLATAHASGIHDFKSREVYTPLWKKRIFDTIVIMHRDKSFHTEDMACISNGSEPY